MMDHQLMKFKTTNFGLKHLLLAVLFTSSGQLMAQTANLEAGIQALEKKEYASSLRIILPLAERGDAEAQVFIAYMYEGGLGVQKDYKEAFVWYEKAAAKGQVTAQFNLAYLYKNGLGIAKDNKQAAFWYEKAANNGFAPAQNNLAYMYEKGIGVTRNYALAASWYQKAAEQSHKNAQINLAYLHENGLGVPKDIDKAIILYERALLASEKLSSDDVKFARDRLDAIRSSLIRKDFIEPRNKAEVSAPVVANPKKEIYSEVMVAPDLSETRINRSAAAPQVGIKPLSSATLPAVSTSKQPEKKELASPPSIATAKASKPEITSGGALGPQGGVSGAVSNTAVSTGIEQIPSKPVIIANNVESAASQPKPALATTADPSISETDLKGKKKSKSKDKKVVDQAVTSLGLTKEESVVDVSGLQKAPSLPAIAAVTPKPTAAPVVPDAASTVPSIDVLTPIKNPDNLPIYGLDGRPIKTPVRGSLALKGIQNDFEDLDSNFWLAKATVLIVDPANNYQPYAKGGVTVRGYFEPTGGDTSCVTDAQGKCTLISARIRTNVGSVRMKIYSVSK